jgi:hypothetical protein
LVLPGIANILAAGGGSSEVQPVAGTSASKELYKIKPGTIEIQSLVTPTYEITTTANK